MATLYVTEPGAVVRRIARSIVVTVDDRETGSGRVELAEVEPHRLDLVMLFGRTHITSEATRFCLREGIDVAWLTRGGRLLGRVVSQLSRSGGTRLSQYRRMDDETSRLVFAREVVTAKIANSAAVLRGVQSNRRGDKALATAISSVDRASAGVGGAEDFPSLLGLEGTAARHYFAGLARSFVSDIKFSGRARRPPPDPANSLLSLGYVILGNLIGGHLEARGLDPSLGFYHELRPGRPSLALDLVEELRAPVIDRLVLRLCNLRIIRPEMFTPDKQDGGVRLTRPGLKIFLAQWQKALERPMRERVSDTTLTGHQVIRRQAELLAADLRGGEKYQALRISR